MRLKKLIFMCLSPFLSEGAFAQVNLVKNPSFENIYHCPNGPGEIDSAVNWRTPVNGGGGSPELYSSCYTGVDIGVPINNSHQSFQQPHFGNNYAGIDVISSYQINNWREYIQGDLIDTLITGKTYCVTFYASLLNFMGAFIKPLGVYLDNGAISAPAPHGLAPYTPQVYNTGQQLSDTLNWMKIEGSFTANGTERYITIGNFFTDAASDIGFVGTPAHWYSYYYIDDVSVIDFSTQAYAGRDSTIALGDSVFVGRPPEVGLNEDCIWYVNNVPIDTVAGMWVKPTVPTTYVLQQTICGTTTYDSIKVNIEGVGINELIMDNYITISPNPFTSQTTISFSEPQKNTTIKIMDVVGKEIKTVLFSGKSLILEKGEMQSGVYFVQITDEKKNVVNKKVVVE